MIHCFPIPYPDELFYSLVARRELQMGYPSYKGLLREVFGCTSLVVNFEFPSHLSLLTRCLPSEHACADPRRLENTTLLPWYAPFLPPERSGRIREAMGRNGGVECRNWAGITASRVKAPAFLRYCPDCLREDQASGWIPYWRRLHQVAGIEICPKHRVFLEDSGICRGKRKYRHLLPDRALLEMPSRRAPNDSPLVGLARLGEQLLSRKWPVLGPPPLRRTYLAELGRRGDVNARGHVRMAALLQDIQSFYGSRFLQRLGCRGQHWLVRMLRSSVSFQQPIRHLLLLHFIGVGLENLFEPKPLGETASSTPVRPANLTCDNHLCPERGKPASGFVGAERSSMLGGVIETYICGSCGQVKARCCAGHERTWVRDYGPLWRARLAALWGDSSLGLSGIASALQVGCDAARRNGLKMGLPRARPGHPLLSARSYPHLLVSKSEKRRQRIETLRERWLAGKRRRPELGTRGLRKKLPAVYATLYRYDRDWLQAHLPPPKRRAKTIDWTERDAALCRQLELAAGGAQNLTPGRLAHAAGVTIWISNRLSRLPRAKSTLLKLTVGRLAI